MSYVLRAKLIFYKLTNGATNGSDRNIVYYFYKVNVVKNYISIIRVVIFVLQYLT